MRKLIMWNMVTLDGLFEGAKSWDLDWHNYSWGEEMGHLYCSSESILLSS